MMYGGFSPLEQMLFPYSKIIIDNCFFDPVKIIRNLRAGDVEYRNFPSVIPFLLEKDCLQTPGLYQEQKKTSRMYSAIRGKARGITQIEILDQFMRIRKKAEIVPIADDLRCENLSDEYYFSNGSLRSLALSQTDLELCSLSTLYQAPILTEDLGIAKYMGVLSQQGCNVVPPVVYYRFSDSFTQ